MLYADYFKKEAEVLVSVRIRNKFKQKFRGREEIDLDDNDQQDERISRIL